MLAGDRSRSQPKETVMNPIRRIRRLAAVLAGLACAWLGIAAAAPAAFAMIPGPPASESTSVAPAPAVPAVTHIVVTGGMPGWQIALIAIGAALLAAATAVLADRAWAARRKTITTAA
jgi:hypothetical protein